MSPVTLQPNKLNVVLAALREHLDGRLQAARLQENKVKVGGWEIVPERQPVLSVYAHEGTFFNKAGYQAGEHNTLTVILTYRSSNTRTESDVLMLRDALRGVLLRFRHEALAGIEITGWNFDFVKLENSTEYEQELRLTGKIHVRSNPHAESEEEYWGVIEHIVFQVSQQEE